MNMAEDIYYSTMNKSRWKQDFIGWNMKDYEHIKCKCGGIIGMYNRNNFACERCNAKYELHKLNYDVCLINDKTGWIFPMVDVDLIIK